MNHLDELLGLYPSSDWGARRYLLSHVGTLSAGLETDALLEFLWGETASEIPSLRHMARRQLGRVLPSCLRQTYGLEAARAGVWSAWAAAGSPGLPAAVTALPAGAGATGNAAQLLAAGWQPLWPLLERTLELLATGSPRIRLSASLVAGRVQTRTGMGALSRSVASRGTVSFLHAVALADLGAREAQARLVELVAEAGARAADLAMLLSDVPADRAVPALSGLAQSADPLVLTNVALALSGDGGAPARELLGRLVARGSGWVTAFALDALAAHPQTRDVALAEQVYARERGEFLKVQAVKLVGAVPGPDGLEFLKEALRAPLPRVKSAALEALARKKADAAPLARDAARELTSPVLKLRVNAMLVLARTDPAAIQPALDALVAADDVVSRIEAAYVLGYLRSPAGCEVLGDLIASDPALLVRLQAIKSLSKADPLRAQPILLAAALDPHPRVAALAARALSASPDSALEPAAEGLRVAAGKARNPVLKGVLLRAFGIAVSRRGLAAPVPDVLQVALSDAEEPVVLGALEGIKCLGGDALDRVVTLATSSNARLRHRAAVAAFLQGHVPAAASLGELLDSPEESRVQSGLQALLEIAILMPVALAAPQFSALRAARAALAARPAAAEFARSEEPRSAPEEPLRARERGPPAGGRFEPLAVQLQLQRPARAARPPASGAARTPDAPLDRRQIEGATYLSGLPFSPRTVGEVLRLYRPLVVAAVLLAVPLVLILSRWQSGANGAAGHQPLPEGALRVAEVKGKAERGLPGRKLAPVAIGMDVAPGERVATGPGAQLLLSDGHGGAIYLGESSGVVVAVPAASATTPAATAFVFQDLSGDVLIDFKKTKGIELIFDREHLAGPAFAVRLLEDSTGRNLSVVSGEPRLFRPGSPGQRLIPGQTVALPAAAP